MSRIWMILWIILLLSQAVTLWLSRAGPSRAVVPDDAMAAELVSLASTTLEAWRELMPNPQQPGPADYLTPQQEILQREALMLELRDTEKVLFDREVEINLTDDLQQWISVSAGNGSLNDRGLLLRQYIGNLNKWLSRFTDEAGPCTLNRLNLHPAGQSDFPAIAFEMSGSPPLMGRGLLALEQIGSAWKLQEMDLLRPGEALEWWLRGSFVFSGDRPR
jgi:hypothetical protein